MPITLETMLRSVIGTSAAPLESARSIRTVGEALDFLPRSYVDPSRPTDFKTIVDGEEVVLLATVARAITRPMRQRRGRMLVATVVDEDGGEMDLTFFRPFGHERVLVPGARVICSGTASTFARRRQLTHPEYQILRSEPTPSDADTTPTQRSSTLWILGRGLIPVYPQVKNMSPIRLHAAMDLVLHALDELPDPIPANIRAARNLPALRTAYTLVHQPGSEKDVARAKWRMKYGEAFVIQASLASRRHAEDALPATPREATTDGLVDAFVQQLPFELTGGQVEVLASLREDLARPLPMHRLLQGEVGSGKTILALLSMLTVIDAGGQAALLAPTEVLATQHHRSISGMLGPLAQAGMLSGAQRSTRVALLTGSQSAPQRRANLLLAASGEAGIVIGTHALIQDHVQFAELGLVVVDEQHRFGVEQRDALRAKAADAPHVLVMTATPIPRTVAMTVYGDMEVSTLRELPRGRQPIGTHVVTGDRPGWVERTWKRVAEEAAAGNRVYVVCPRIGEDESEGEGADGDAERVGIAGADHPGPGVPQPVPAGEEGPVLYGVLQVHRALSQMPVTTDLRIGLLHGRMPAEAKDAAMLAFTAGELDVLVATTVIEVGVDVPDATVMVILDADRFGISQLHQLRGRVGRGEKPGLCLLLTQGVDGPAHERLTSVAATTDGFELARIDLETRREGDVLGASQSGGRSGLRHLRLARDEDLIVSAHDDAWSTVQADPDLSRHTPLREAIAALDADRAAFLERG